MGMFCYKMFAPGLKCRGYQFKVGVNECEHATCVKEGFHAAENPLDCLSYYPNFDTSECWLCYADGEIHEKGDDSKLSCTRLEILRRLEKWEFVYEACRYIIDHPWSDYNRHVQIDVGTTAEQGFAIVVGEAPQAKANANGDIVALIVKSEHGKAEKLIFLYGEETKKGVVYEAWRDKEDGC